MKKDKLEKNGFALVLVIIIIASFSTYLFILTGASNAIMFESDEAYLHSVQENLTLSALAWAAKNKGENENFKKIIKLDASAFKIKDANLTVSLEKTDNTQPQVLVNTSCSFGRHTLKQTQKF